MSWAVTDDSKLRSVSWPTLGWKFTDISLNQIVGTQGYICIGMCCRINLVKVQWAVTCDSKPSSDQLTHPRLTIYRYVTQSNSRIYYESDIGYTRIYLVKLQWAVTDDSKPSPNQLTHPHRRHRLWLWLWLSRRKPPHLQRRVRLWQRSKTFYKNKTAWQPNPFSRRGLWKMVICPAVNIKEIRCTSRRKDNGILFLW